MRMGKLWGSQYYCWEMTNSLDKQLALTNSNKHPFSQNVNVTTIRTDWMLVQGLQSEEPGWAHFSRRRRKPKKRIWWTFDPNPLSKLWYTQAEFGLLRTINEKSCYSLSKKRVKIKKLCYLKKATERFIFTSMNDPHRTSVYHRLWSSLVALRQPSFIRILRYAHITYEPSAEPSCTFSEKLAVYSHHVWFWKKYSAVKMWNPDSEPGFLQLDGIVLPRLGSWTGPHLSWFIMHIRRAGFIVIRCRNGSSS